MEYSLTSYDRSKQIQFKTFLELIEYLKEVGEVDGWIIHIHHL